MTEEDRTWEEQEEEDWEKSRKNKPRISDVRKKAAIALGLGGAAAIVASLPVRSMIRTTTKSVLRLDVLGWTCVAAAGGLLAPMVIPNVKVTFVNDSPTHTKASPSPHSDYFEFKILNKKWYAEKAKLEKVVNLSPFWFPKHVRDEFKALKRKENLEKRNQLIKKEKQIEQDLLNDLKTGSLSSNEILQKLTKRVYVVDFSDYSETIPSSEDLTNETQKSTKNLESTKEWVAFLRDTVSMLIHTATKFDEIVIRLTSPGGSVSEYGLAAAQLLRLKDAGFKVVVCIDTVCASGGYLMACCADEIVAQPFALVGSIGVVAELPNFHRLLEKYDVDYMLFTAGQYKRTVSTLAEITEEGKEKFVEQLEEIHEQFRDHVSKFRSSKVNMDMVGTGEAWLATRARELGLVDRILTSDGYLDEKEDQGFDIVEVKLRSKKPKISSLLWNLVDLDLDAYVPSTLQNLLQKVRVPLLAANL